VARESFPRVVADAKVDEMKYDLLIRNATVIDGTRAPRFAAGIAVMNGRIATIGPLKKDRAGVEIDAHGRIVAPGFIDAHTHDDRLMLSAPDMTPKVSQGVTTVVAGNCGISLAPAPRGMDKPVPPLDLLDENGSWFRFTSFRDYVAALRGQPAATNCALFAGHTLLRVQTMDNVERPATPAEVRRMRVLADEARNGVYVTHMRDEVDGVVDSLEETFRIAGASSACRW
jgi:N-acyl-D-amino-acid deacylase